MTLSDITQALALPAHALNPEITSVSIDTRTLKAGALFVALEGEHFNGHDFIDMAEKKQAAALITSQPVDDTSLPNIIVDNTLAALTALAEKWRETFNIPIIALTGSCGKTTTKTLIATIFNQSYCTLATEGTLNNHIGVPLTLMRLDPKHQAAVIEIGANHQGEIAQLTQLVKPNIALITNVAPVHLEGFGSIEGVFQAKSEIFQGLDKHGIALINADDSFAQRWYMLNQNKKIIRFGRADDADIRAENISLDPENRPAFTLITPQGKIRIKLHLIGEHQVINALAAAAASYAHHIPLAQIKAGLETTEPIQKRLSVYQTSKGTHIIDDSYNANPSSTKAALNILARAKNKRFFVFADMLELGEDAAFYHREIGTLCKQMGIDKLFTYGKLAHEATQCFGHNAEHFQDQADLTDALNNSIDHQTTVLIKGSNSMKMWHIIEGLR